MKKIGILTYHRSYNYGAFMQSYSLSKKLQETFPNCKIEIVDYCSEEVYLQYNKSLKNLSRLIFSAKPFRRKFTYIRMLWNYIFHETCDVDSQNFTNALQYLPLSKYSIISDDHNKVIEYINSNYDIIISGSDAVWNWQIRKFPNPYLLGAEILTPKLSYAASSYGQPFAEITSKQQEYLTQAWNSIEYIGVRDLATEEFVKYVTGKNVAFHNCDPTCFLDLTTLPVDRSLVYDKLIQKGFNPKKKTIGIMAKPWLAKLVREHIDNSYQIVSIFNYNAEADVNILNLNPFEWSIIFSFFDITITHYFHGNLLSLKNNVPTICIEEDTEYNRKYNSKIRDLMKRLDLSEYCIYKHELTTSPFLLNEIISHIIEDNTTIKQTIENSIQCESLHVNSFLRVLSGIIKEC